MVESEIDEYKLDTNQGKKEQTLRVSIVTNDRICMLISNPKDLKDRYINLITLKELRDVCGAFNATNTISEAAVILKSAIENNCILYSEDEESGNVEIKFNITIGKKSYPAFVIPLPYDTDSDDEQYESEILIENQNPNVIQSQKEEEIEVLPTKFDYQGNKEAEAKYGRSTKSTIDYENHIIRSGVKKPNVILEYIEPILQVHYPDGTTKSTPLPPRIQTADGKSPNIDPEQLKSIREQIAKNFNQSLAEIEKENRSNSVAHRNIKNNNITSNYSRQTVGTFENINALKSVNSDNINYENNSRFNNGNNNIVSSALKPKDNFNNIVNISNIRQVRTAFNPYDNNRNEQRTNLNSTIPKKNLVPRDNLINYNRNQLNNKGISDYSISSMPNKSVIVNNFSNETNIINHNNKINLNNFDNSNYMSYTQNPQSLIQEVPRMLNQSININMNQDMYQRSLNRSSSTPSIETVDTKTNFNFYNNNQSHTQQYNFQQNNTLNQNQSLIQSQINNVNIQFPFWQANQSQILQTNQNLQNSQNSNNNSIYFNQTQNPYLNKNAQYQNKNQIFNIPQDFNINFDISHSQFQSNNFLNRHNSRQVPKSHISLLQQNQIQQQKAKQMQQHLAQNLFQQQQRNQTQKQLQEQQRNQTQKQLQEQQRNQAQKQMQEPQRNQAQKQLQERQRNQAQNNLQEQQKIKEKQRLIQISQQRKQMLNIYSQQMNQNPKKSQNSVKGIVEVNPLSQRNPHTNHILRNQHSQPMDNPRSQTSKNKIKQSKNKNQKSQNSSYHPLKQSQSQQIIKPSSPKKNGITQQQIDLAQMASLQNLQNPNNFNASTVQLKQKFLDSSGKEETQSQYEREEMKYQDNEEHQETQASLGKHQEYEKETPLGEKQENSEESHTDNEAENLYRTETGLIIFRNGLLHGIIHKYAEIDDVVSKIQLKLKAGVKFMILYIASKDGDKAKIFHQKCNGHKMTLVLVETTKGVRFGGFTTQSWDGNCIKKLDNNAFVFNLNKRRIYDIVKNEYAIGGYPKFGPVFFGCQIRIYDDFFKKGGTTCHKYLNYKTKEDYELNNGEQSYIVKEIEVYSIETIDV